MRFDDLGLTPYRDAWAAQEAAHADVLAGGPERVFLVEHPPVVTFGRRPGGDRHLRVSAEELAGRGVELVESDRGGDVTYHAPGQLVVYPILRLATHGFTVSAYVHWLERVVIDMLAAIGVPAHADPAAVGVWTDKPPPAKVCAIGVRIRRGRHPPRAGPERDHRPGRLRPDRPLRPARPAGHVAPAGTRRRRPGHGDRQGHDDRSNAFDVGPQIRIGFLDCRLPSRRLRYAEDPDQVPPHPGLRRTSDAGVDLWVDPAAHQSASGSTARPPSTWRNTRR